MPQPAPVVRNLAARLGVAMLILAAVGAGCGGGGEARVDPNASHPGRALYYVHCVACHGREGAGAKNLFPPLAGSPWVLGPAEVPIRVVLHGLQGPLTVRGEDYLNLMPGLGDRLTDRQIADVLSYVRISWGNAADSVSAAEVGRIRAATNDREKPFPVPDMEAIRAALGTAGAGSETGAAGSADSTGVTGEGK